ncbi:MAG TPA: hypothetical protein VMP67_06785 [Candidatus Limnocylindria bacterium]|nr:hypothetical protein [Candidatus Limnocylindria bacterium]
MAIIARRPPWYRRLFRRERALAAGERPRNMGERRGSPLGLLKPLFALLLLAIPVAAVVGYAALPDVRSRVDEVVADLRLSFLPNIDPVHPIRAEGPGPNDHPAAHATDDNTLTYWLTDPAGGGPLRVTFSEPFNLGGLVFHSGSATDSDFLLHRRPRTVELRFPGTEHDPRSIELGDDSEAQSRAFDVRDVRVIEVRVIDSYPAGPGGDNRIALREIEFKARR